MAARVSQRREAEGGGGRISLWYRADGFSGITLARGGSGYVYGGAGTIYTRANGQPTGKLLVDNGGAVGANTLLSSGEPFDLTAQGGAMISLPSSVTLTNRPRVLGESRR